MLPILSCFFLRGSDLSLWIYWLAGGLLMVLITKLLKDYRRLRAQPPGPRGLPILGNVLQVPKRMPWFRFTEWAQEFGPIFSLNLAGQSVIVLNTFEAASDLLDRRSHIYSDRPRFIMSGEILTGGIAIVFASSGKLLRKLRRASHEGLNMRAIERYRLVLAREAAFACIQMMTVPEIWQDHISRASASVILSAIYGWPSLTDLDDPLVKEIHSMGATITKGVNPGAYLVDIIPILDYLPLWMMKWKQKGLEWHQQVTEMLQGFNKAIEEKMLEDQSLECFVSDLIKNKEHHELTSKEAAWLAGIIFLAGPEALSATISYFLLAMLLHPESMRKAQAELDDVIGRERIPTFEDQKKLPYIDAVIKETLRWRPPAPIGVPRKVTKDDWYNGYLIPKGATVISNIWAMHRDENIFPNFDEFQPERFLDEVATNTHSLGHTAFGFGRRICVGSDFANQTLFIMIATILWAMEIQPAIDSEGNTVVPSKHGFVETGIAVGPAPFKCNFVLRFPDSKSILRRQLTEE